MKKKYIAPESNLVLLDSNVLYEEQTGGASDDMSGGVTKQTTWDDDDWNDESDGLW